MSYPPNLNSNVNYVNVLHLMERNVKPHLPQSVTCLFCPHSMQVLEDVLGGSWYRCPHCGFAGDSFELYQAYIHEPNIHKVISQLSQKLDLTIPPESLADYVERIYPNRQAFNKFWRIAQHKLVGLGNTAQTLLNHYDLYAGHPWRTSMPFGLTTKYMLDILPDPPTLKGSALVLPLQDMPGRYVGFHMFGNNFQKTYVPDDLDTGTTLYSGMFFVDALEFDNDTVYVVDDPLLALRMRLQYQLATGAGNPPILSWLGADPALWGRIKAKRMIFWGSGDVDAQANASYAEEVLISHVALPDLAHEDAPTEYLKILQHIQETAEPIKTGHVRPPDIAPTAELGNTKFIERSDGVYFSDGKHPWKLLSDVKLIADLVLHDQKGNDHFVGRAVYKRKSYPLTVNIQEFNAKRIDVMYDYIESITGSRPFISRPWVHKLMGICLKCHPTITQPLYSDVVWDETTRTWNTPCMSISGTCIKNTPVPYGFNNLPGSLIQTPSTSGHPELMKLLENPSVFAIFTYVLFNILAFKDRLLPIRIGVVAGRQLIDDVQQGLGLKALTCTRLTSFESTYANQLRNIPLPVSIAVSGKFARDRHMVMDYSGSICVIAEIPAVSASCPEFFPDWKFIPDISESAIGVWRLLPNMLQYLAACNNELPNGKSQLERVALAVADWSKVANVPWELLQCTHTSTKAQRAVGKLVQLLAEVPENMMSELNHTRIKASQAEQRTILNATSIWAKLSKHGQPVPPQPLFCDWLREDNAFLGRERNGIIIKYDWWTDCCERLVNSRRQASLLSTDLIRLLARVSGEFLTHRQALEICSGHASSTTPHS